VVINIRARQYREKANSAKRAEATLLAMTNSQGGYTIPPQEKGLPFPNGFILTPPWLTHPAGGGFDNGITPQGVRPFAHHTL